MPVSARENLTVKLTSRPTPNISRAGTAIKHQRLLAAEVSPPSDRLTYASCNQVSTSSFSAVENR
eukprot:974111-Pyramimonas_sp.AAC.1